MTLKEYEKHCLRTANGGERTLTDKERIILNCVCGLSGETGELIDAVKKHIFHGHGFDEYKAIKELGDIHWYWSVMCNVLEIDPDEVLQLNINKLEKRYPDGFSTKDSIERRDVNEINT